MNQPSAFSYISFIGRVGWVEGKKIITKTRNFKTTKEEESKSELATTSASNEVLLKRSAPPTANLFLMHSALCNSLLTISSGRS